MRPKKYYQDRIVTLKAHYATLMKRKSLLALLRFAAIALLAFAVYILLPVGISYVFLATIFLLAIFIRFIYLDIKNKTAIKNNLHLQKINEDELNALAHQYYQTWSLLAVI